jgi:N-acetylmuramoyl-L-alanine amidase
VGPGLRPLAIALVPLLLVGAEARERDRFDTVVIDAGHGGDDEGARGPGSLTEKELVLDVARRLADRLRQHDLRVVLTRSDDRFVPLERRTAIANDARGDLFLSIHANAARTGRARGVETYFLSLEASDDAARQVAQRENEAFRRAGPAQAPGDDPLVSILGDLIATEHVIESDEFARLAQGELATLDSDGSRGVKQAPFVVLMGLQMPASLIEIGFVTNPGEAVLLRSTKRRDRIAELLTRAVVEFGRRYDARRGEPDGARASGGGGG